MKIGIITVPDSANFGSFLQAYALKIVLEKEGHTVEFVASRNKEYVKKIFYNWRPSLYALKHPINFLKKNQFGYYKYKYFKNDHKKINISSNYSSDSYDLVILGSDEIWNVSTKVFRHAIFYGEGFDCTIAYAVSAGQATYDDFLRYPDIIDKIKKINAICTRDYNTTCIVEKLTAEKPKEVCDPTFLVDWEEYCEKINDSYLDNNKYILIYLYSGALALNSIKIIQKFARKNGLKTISAGLYNDWCDYNVNCSPTQFCSVIEKAEYVITATFHGTIFSIINKKRFVSIGLTMKVKDLLKKFELDSQCVAEKDISENLLEKKLFLGSIDYDQVNEIISVSKEYSLKTLEEMVKKYDRDM